MFLVYLNLSTVKSKRYLKFNKTKIIKKKLKKKTKRLPQSEKSHVSSWLKIQYKLKQKN